MRRPPSYCFRSLSLSLSSLACLKQTSLVAFQGIFNALVYGSTDAVKSAVAQELLVERCLKASGAGRGGGAGGGTGGAPGAAGDTPATVLDPEDEEDGSSGMELGWVGQD